MTTDQIYWIRWEQRRNRVERLWQKKVFKALQSQVRAFTQQLSRGSIQQARQDIGKVVTTAEIEKVIKALYIQAGLLQANVTYRQVKAIERTVLKFVGFGYNQEWTNSILDYFQYNLLDKAVLPITETTRKLILRILDQAQREGWSNDRAVQEIMKYTDDINLSRARVIVRTESVRAMNYGTMLGADKSALVLDKRWITAHDERVRPSHRDQDGVKIDMEGTFPNGCSFPGDPDGGAKETINCRCTIALVPKRDEKGSVIRRIGGIRMYDRRRA